MMRVFGRMVVAGQIMAIYIPAATYFAATNGTDSNPGTQLAPFRHLSKAADAARQPGDTVIVMDGSYDNEGVVATPDGRGSVVTLKYSGTPGKPITFRTQNRGGAILDAANTSNNAGPYACNAAWAYFDLGNVAYVVIQGFVIQHGCFNGIRANGNAHDITIKWNEIRNIGNWDSGGGVLSATGIYLNSSEHDFTFDGNIFHDIGGGRIVNQEHGIYTSASNVTICNNVFYNQVHGFYNQVHGWGIQTAGGTNLLIINNTFAFPNPHRDGHLMLWDGSKAGSLSNVTIRNNIFHNPGHIAVVTDLRAAISGSCAIDHNLTNAGSIFDGGSACMVNNNRTNTDPRLVNTSTPPYDFHLRPGSPAVGAGVPVPSGTVISTGRPARWAQSLPTSKLSQSCQTRIVIGRVQGLKGLGSSPSPLRHTAFVGDQGVRHRWRRNHSPPLPVPCSAARLSSSGRKAALARRI